MTRDKVILTRVTAEEHQAIRELAARAGMSMGAYLRSQALDGPEVLYDGPHNPQAFDRLVLPAGPNYRPPGLGVAKRIRDDKGNRI